ncbi:GNAT family N-acetyltransferase [Corynebacterium pyruviciproducens]
MSTKEITKLFTAVGLGSVPAWVRPYNTLSNGEKFRANMARAIAETTPGSVTVIDEFTSVVDRQVARITSHCVQKQIRRDASKKFVAVTCHFDVEEWLQPDWVYNVQTQKFVWRSVQPRPQIKLNLYECSTKVWQIFAPHHYLSSKILANAHCYIATLEDGTPVAFTSYRHFPHPKIKDMKMMHRTVVLPDFQGLGISERITQIVAQMLSEKGYRVRRTIAHPIVVHACAKSKRWKLARGKQKKIPRTTTKTTMAAGQLDSRQLTTYSFQYVPIKHARS